MCPYGHFVFFLGGGEVRNKTLQQYTFLNLHSESLNRNNQQEDYLLACLQKKVLFYMIEFLLIDLFS